MCRLLCNVLLLGLVLSLRWVGVLLVTFLCLFLGLVIVWGFVGSIGCLGVNYVCGLFELWVCWGFIVVNLFDRFS